MTSRKIQSEATRQTIIQVCQKMFSEYDMNTITIQDITKACGIAKGTFYCHFKSKEELFAIICLLPGASCMDALAADDSSPVLPRLRAYVMSRLELLKKEGPRFRKNVNQNKLTETYIECRSVFMRDDYELVALRSFFEKAIAGGRLSKDAPYEFIAETIIYAIRGVDFHANLYNRTVDQAEWGEKFCDYIDMILKPFIPSSPGQIG